MVNKLFSKYIKEMTYKVNSNFAEAKNTNYIADKLAEEQAKSQINN